MRALLLLAAFLSVPQIARAAETDPWADTGIRGVFQRTGNTFACKLALSKRFSPDDYLNVSTDQPCLFFGPSDTAIAIGSFAKQLLTNLGEPISSQPDRGDSTSHFFRFADSDNPPFLS